MIFFNEAICETLISETDKKEKYSLMSVLEPMICPDWLWPLCPHSAFPLP